MTKDGQPGDDNGVAAGADRAKDGADGGDAGTASTRGKPRWSADKKSAPRRGGPKRRGPKREGQGTRGGANTAAITKAERRLNRRAGRDDAGPGVPKAVERTGAGKLAIQTPARLSVDDNARLTWMLDLLAWTGHGVVAGRIDLRGTSAALPPVVLPEVGADLLVALEPVDAIRRLRSRHRAFSQMAGRYSALLLAARDAGRRLRIEMWDLDEHGALRAPDPSLDRLWPQLASYLEGEVFLGDEATLKARMALALATPLAPSLVARNPVAWGLHLAQGPGVVQPAALGEDARVEDALGEDALGEVASGAVDSLVDDDPSAAAPETA